MSPILYTQTLVKLLHERKDVKICNLNWELYGNKKWACSASLIVKDNCYNRKLVGNNKKQARDRLSQTFLEILQDFYSISKEQKIPPIPKNVSTISSLLGLDNVHYHTKTRRWKAMSMIYNPTLKLWSCPYYDYSGYKRFQLVFHEDLLKLLKSVPIKHRLPYSVELVRRHILITGLLEGNHI